MRRRQLRRALEAAGRAEDELLRELDRIRRTELVLVAIDVTEHAHGPITRRSILWRKSVETIAEQAAAGMTSLWAPADSMGDSLALDQAGFGDHEPIVNLYAVVRP